MKIDYRIALAAVALLLVLSACSSPTPSPVSTQAPGVATKASSKSTSPADQGYPPPAAVQGYPAPGATPGDQSYPAPASNVPGYVNPAYPAPPTPTENPGTKVEVTPFKLDKPLIEGATEITGVGPAGIPIVLVDITFNGQILSEAVIPSDGKFSFKLTTPLEKAHRLGLTVGDLQKTQWVGKNFDDPGFQGTEPQQVPNLGFFFDTAMVQGK